MESKRQQCTACVVASGRNLHARTLTDNADWPATAGWVRRQRLMSHWRGVEAYPLSPMAPEQPPTLVVPTYGRGCVSDLMPALLGGHGASAGATSLPIDLDAGQPKVLLVLDGLGWDQLVERWDLCPNLHAATGDRITTVAPSTTAAALTSITTGLTPGEHGIVGYRMVLDGMLLNCLRWGTDERGDARKTSPPDLAQPYDPFLGQAVAMVSKAEFRTSGFSKAHLRGARLTGYRTTAVLVHETARLIGEGEPFVYAYYDGVDKVSHEYGLGSEFDAEFAFADRLVGDMLAALPSGTQLIVTADHGQVDCRNGVVAIDDGLTPMIDRLSGEGRFRWLHAVEGTEAELLAAATDAYSDVAWVASLDQIIDEAWFGDRVSDEARRRLGDVALLPFEPIAFEDPADTGPFALVGRHGSLTSEEMYVPLLSAMAT